MIMTKAFITQLPQEGDNTYRVRVPLMEDNTSNIAEFEAVASNSPGSYNGYSVDDVVIVHFEDHQMNRCIILGKLYTSVPEEDKTYLLGNHLKVTSTAELPKDTKIDGKSLGNIIETLNNVINISGGNGDIDPSKLNEFVKYIINYRYDEPYYADRIKVMSGEEYDGVVADDEDADITLYFLTSPSARETLGAEDADIQG